MSIASGAIWRFPNDHVWICVSFPLNPLGPEANKAVGGDKEQKEDFQLVPIWPTSLSQSQTYNSVVFNGAIMKEAMKMRELRSQWLKTAEDIGG